jgi:cell division protein YceG involved in septum cleavage
MKKTLIYILLVVVFLLLVLCMALFVSNQRLSRSAQELRQDKAQAEGVINIPQSRIRDDIKKSLDEKYRADIVSQRAMIKRLEQEKQMSIKQEEGE